MRLGYFYFVADLSISNLAMIIIPGIGRNSTFYSIFQLIIEEISNFLLK